MFLLETGRDLTKGRSLGRSTNKKTSTKRDVCACAFIRRGKQEGGLLKKRTIAAVQRCTADVQERNESSVTGKMLPGTGKKTSDFPLPL